MGILNWLFGDAEELPQGPLEADLLEELPLGSHYEVDPYGNVVGVYHNDADQDPDEYDDSNSNGFW